MADNAYNFPVGFAPIATVQTGRVVPGRVAVVNEDTGEPLAVVSDQYKLIPHANVVDRIKEALDGVEHTEGFAIARKGARMYAQFEMRHFAAEVRKGDEVGFRFTVRNSYDGSTALQVIGGALRLVCMNGMVTVERGIEWSFKHIGAEIGLKVDALREHINAVQASFINSKIPLMQAMAQKQLGPSTMEAFNPETLKLPEYIVKEAEGEFERADDRSVWGFYNALTWAVTHKQRRETIPLQLNEGRMVWKAALAELHRN